ncbi:MAG: hypothetical protein JNK64_20850 [Myxococcales bacterium]|nr:hypothetical protein [Myxococcales bacterium]
MTQQQQRDPQPATGEAKRAHPSPCSISATMQPQRWSGVAAALALGWAGPASAGEAERAPPPIALTYDAPAACSEEQLRDALTARVPEARIASDAAVVVIARIADSREGYLAELTVIAPGAPADRRLFPPSVTCVDATDALAGAIAGHLAALPPPALAPGERPVAWVRRPVARFEFGAGGELLGGDGAGLAIEAGYLRLRGPWWAGGMLRLQTRSETLGPAESSARTYGAADLVGLARVCRRGGPIELCGLVGAGLRRLSETDRFSSYSSLGGFGAVGGRAALVIPIGRRVEIAVWGEALMLAGQPTLYTSDIGSGAGNVIVAGSVAFAIEPAPSKSPRHP